MQLWIVWKWLCNNIREEEYSFLLAVGNFQFVIFSWQFPILDAKY
jgi:hypothetical protein